MADETWHPQAGRDYPGNWHQLLGWFPDDAACLRFLERLRWREGFVCRFRGTSDGGWWQMFDGLRRCSVCRSETSVTAGTILARTRTPLTRERHDGGPGRVRMRRIPNASADTLTEFVLDHVARGSEIHTDGWGGYNDIGRSHVVTNVSASGDPAHVAMPEVHRVASLLKRWLLGTHQGAVSHDQLDLLPRRVHVPLQPPPIPPSRLLFYRLLEGAVETDPHPYKALISETAT